MLGERIRQARLAAGLSLEGLAERLERPLTKQALSKYERGAVATAPQPTHRYRRRAQRAGVVACSRNPMSRSSGLPTGSCSG